MWTCGCSVDREKIAYLLRLAFVGTLTLMVDAAEVGNDDRNRKCDDEHAAERADTADDLADHRVRYHVAVAGDTETTRRLQISIQVIVIVR